MRSIRRSTLATGLLALASHVSAQVASVCPTTNVCFKLNIPASTASSGSGDIFFQLSAPSSYEWVGLGQGSGMSGSNIFVIYANGNGNVTLSPRLGTGHSMPNYNSDAQVTLLEGSGVSNGMMVANVKCSSCNSWSGGSADFTSSKGNWIYAYKSSGGPKNSNDQSASISQHSGQEAFSWDYSNAKGGSSVNPLVSSGSSGTASGGASVTSCVPRPSSSGAGGSAATAATATTNGAASGTQNPSGWTAFATASPTGRHFGPPDKDKREEKRQNVNYCDDNSNSNTNNNSGFTSLGGSRGGNQTKMLIAHGVLAALAFVILFPAGAIAIRLASFPGVVWFHAAFQVFAYLVYIAAFGLGVYLANDLNAINGYHPVFGIVIFVCLFFQPMVGLLHHFLYQKYQDRTFWSYVHLWLGRLLITAGIINGGLGFKFAKNYGNSSNSGMIAYSVIAGIMWAAYIVASFIGERRRRRARANAPPKYTDSPAERSSNTEPTSNIPHPPHGHYAPR